MFKKDVKPLDFILWGLGLFLLGFIILSTYDGNSYRHRAESRGFLLLLVGPVLVLIGAFKLFFSKPKK